MTAEEFSAFRERAIREYAAEHVRAGNWTAEEAVQRAARQTDELLPDGVDTPGMLLLVAETAAAGTVGLAWVAMDGEARQPWIYDIEIVAGQRGRGLGRALLEAIEAEVRRQGGSTLGLHVFGSNTVARRLYESAGYQITSLDMKKSL